VLIEDFWTCDGDALSGGLKVDTVRIAEPRFGKVKPTNKWDHSKGSSVAPIAFRVMVPAVYSLNPDAPVTLRIFLYRCDGSCSAGNVPHGKKWDNTDDGLVLSIVGKRLLGIGSGIQDFGMPRTLEVVSFPAGEMRVIDLPLGEGGLECPDVAAGDFLAFEMDTVASNAVYRLLGAEIFSSEDAILANATVVPLTPAD
jgi:hypothetical protein